MNLTQKRRRKGEKSSCGKKKKVSLEKKGVLGEQSGDKKVYDNIYIQYERVFLPPLGPYNSSRQGIWGRF